jgi:hypothetical protein
VWIEEHFEYVVRPMLPANANVSSELVPKELASLFNGWTISNFKNIEDLNGLFFLWAVVKEKAKRLRKPLLLPGRDAYIFTVLGEIDRARIINRPDISTITSPFVKEDYTNTVMTDSGYSGTCARHMGIKDWFLISCGRTHRQIYRGVLPGSNLDASAFGSTFEGVPKYWNRAYMKGDPYNRSYYWHTSLKPDGLYHGATKEQYFSDNPEAMKVTKGSPIVMGVAKDPQVILNAFYLHRWIAMHYTPTAIEMSRVGAENWLNQSDDWKQFLDKRAKGVEIS